MTEDQKAVSELLLRAETIARVAHYTQKNAVTGAPYIGHVERVVAAVEGEEAKAVAWLHDVAEDSDIGFPAMLAAGIPQRIVDAVALLTRTRGSDYSAYIDNVKASRNPLALAVKVADLYDHLTPSCLERLRPRYEAALVELGAPPQPTTPHEDERK